MTIILLLRSKAFFTIKETDQQEKFYVTAQKKNVIREQGVLLWFLAGILILEMGIFLFHLYFCVCVQKVIHCQFRLPRLLFTHKHVVCVLLVLPDFRLLRNVMGVIVDCKVVVLLTVTIFFIL